MVQSQRSADNQAPLAPNANQVHNPIHYNHLHPNATPYASGTVSGSPSTKLLSPSLAQLIETKYNNPAAVSLTFGNLLDMNGNSNAHDSNLSDHHRLINPTSALNSADLRFSDYLLNSQQGMNRSGRIASSLLSQAGQNNRHQNSNYPYGQSTGSLTMSNALSQSYHHSPLASTPHSSRVTALTSPPYGSQLSSPRLGNINNTSTSQHTVLPSTMGNMPMMGYNSYASLLNKANLLFENSLDSMMLDWTYEERECRRRLVQFWRRHESSNIFCTFKSVAAADRVPNSIVVSCIYWEEKQDFFITSVDCIHLLESLIAVRFTVEEKNRIRRNLEGFRPLTVSKCKADSAEFFKLIMAFPNPKPRNIEKDVKVFPWRILPLALKKIIGKYIATGSTPTSITLDSCKSPTTVKRPQKQQQQQDSILMSPHTAAKADNGITATPFSPGLQTADMLGNSSASAAVVAAAAAAAAASISTTAPSIEPQPTSAPDAILAQSANECHYQHNSSLNPNTGSAPTPGKFLEMFERQQKLQQMPGIDECNSKHGIDNQVSNDPEPRASISVPLESTGVHGLQLPLSLPGNGQTSQDISRSVAIPFLSDHNTQAPESQQQSLQHMPGYSYPMMAQETQSQLDYAGMVTNMSPENPVPALPFSPSSILEHINAEYGGELESTSGSSQGLPLTSHYSTNPSPASSTSAITACSYLKQQQKGHVVRSNSFKKPSKQHAPYQTNRDERRNKPDDIHGHSASGLREVSPSVPLIMDKPQPSGNALDLQGLNVTTANSTSAQAKDSTEHLLDSDDLWKCIMGPEFAVDENFAFLNNFMSVGSGDQSSNSTCGMSSSLSAGSQMDIGADNSSLSVIPSSVMLSGATETAIIASPESSIGQRDSLDSGLAEQTLSPSTTPSDSGTTVKSIHNNHHHLAESGATATSFLSSSMDLALKNFTKRDLAAAVTSCQSPFENPASLFFVGGGGN